MALLSGPPAVAVIIPTLNAGHVLGRALQSLAEQRVVYEAVLVDGGSSDDTTEVAAAAPGVRVISAPGTSIYEAINRGIAQSRAPAICLLNADDTLLPRALPAFLEALARNPQAGIVRGWPSFVEQRQDGLLLPRVEGDRRAHRALTLELLLRGPCAINSMCIRRGTFERTGMFDATYRLAADREWMLRVWRAAIAIAEIARPVYRYVMHDGSNTLDRGRRNYATIRREHLAIVARHMPGAASAADQHLVSALNRWHAAEAAMLLASLARGGAWREAARAARCAFRHRPLWPATLANDILRHVTRRNG